MSTLFVGNLPEDVRSREIEDIFKKFGRIDDVNVRSKGKDTFAFITFAHDDDAREALRRRDGYEFDRHHRMRVEASNGKKRERENRDGDRDRRDSRRDDDDNRRDSRRGDDYDRRDRGYGASRNDRDVKRERPAFRFNEKLVKVIVDNLPEGTSWQDLKDFIRTNGAEVKFTQIEEGKGVAGFETRDEADKAIDRMHNTVMKTRDNKEATVTFTLVEAATSIVTPEEPMEEQRRSRSRGSPRYNE